MAIATRSRIATAAVLAVMTVTTTPAGADPLSANDPKALERACDGKWVDVTNQFQEIGCSGEGHVLKCERKGFKPFFKRECRGSAAVTAPKGVVPR